VAYDVHLADRIRSILNGAAEFSEKKMFGGLTFMVNGQMCCGVLKNDLVLRLTPEDADTALHQPHTRPMDFTGRPMKSMIYVSPLGADSDEALTAWIQLAVRLARANHAKGSSKPESDRSGRPSSSGAGVRGFTVPKAAPKRPLKKRN
jgi:TfoX/Sxy family transcriptional regulator of competence genes